MVVHVSYFIKLKRMDAIVLGPGLGRDPSVLPLVLRVIDFVKKTQVPFVIDADGLWFLHESISSIPALPSAILTPNKIEFSRLCEAALNSNDVLSIKVLTTIAYIYIYIYILH
uniref:ATP-dependent NAD(P)H-hydrate dehydratase n=1 Tax=Heterorhabditis bacteriophora TaxID=37862 RepID=A0A1I7W6Q5_HETBA